MPQEQERGITITATTTACRWGRFWINLIDTPGHIDFTIEVERSMRVLDGAIAVFSAVEGVEPQSESVWRQADRYGVPRICFINKMDRVGADYRAVIGQIERKLEARPVLLQLPVGSEASFAGIIDLIDEVALVFSATDHGVTVERQPVPAASREDVRAAREALIETAADFDDAIAVDFLEGRPVEPDRLRSAIRQGTASSRIFPVFLGAALRNKGIQPLLDAVGSYLPSPLDVHPAVGARPGDGGVEQVRCDPKAPLCALAFKVLSDEGRKLTFLRIYAGEIRAGATVFNSTRGCAEKVARLFRMHSHKRERIEAAAAGDIVAASGLKDVLTGDTLCDAGHVLILTGLTVPDPVVSLAVEPRRVEDRDKLPGALEKLQWEDPTFRVREDPETGQTILTGIGELHLEVIIDRLDRDFGVQTKTGRPQVVYRETLRRSAEHREVFRREIDGKVQGGTVVVRVSPLPRGEGVRVILPPPGEPPLPGELRDLLGDVMDQSCQSAGSAGYPVTDVEVRILEAPFEPGVTTEIGLRAAAHRGLVFALKGGTPTILEPIMTLELVTPADYTGKVLGSLQQKRGRIEGVASRGAVEVVRANVPLAEMFGFMTELRSATKGRGSFSMEFSHYDQAPPETQKRFGLAG